MLEAKTLRYKVFSLLQSLAEPAKGHASPLCPLVTWKSLRMLQGRDIIVWRGTSSYLGVVQAYSHHRRYTFYDAFLGTQ